MVKFFKLNFWRLFALLFITSCSAKDNNLSIQFSNDSSAIVISNIERSGFFALKQDQQEGKNLDNIVAVLEIPGEDDSLSMEKELPGKVFINGANIVFKPNKNFIKGKNYLVSTLINARFGGAKEAIKGKLNIKTQSAEKLLIR